MQLNTFHSAFMKWTFPSLNSDISIVANREVNQKSKQNAISVDPDETAHNEPSHQDLHCLHSYLVGSARLNWLISRQNHENSRP